MKPLSRSAILTGLSAALFSLAPLLSPALAKPRSDGNSHATTFRHESVARDATRYEAFLKKAYGSAKANPAALIRNGNALMGRDLRAASRAFAKAAANAPGRSEAWVGLARALLDLPVKLLQGSERYDLPVNAAGAAYLGYQRATSNVAKANALDVLARALKRRSYWRPAIDALKIAKTLQPSAARTAAYEALRSTHGFRVINYTTQSEQTSPRICITFSEALSKAPVDFSRFVTANGADAAGVSPEGRDLCVDGFTHGERAQIKLRAGLPSDIGETLLKDVELAIYVPDRKPAVRFNGSSYVLPSRGQQGIPVVSINTQAIDVEVYRIGDRAISGEVGSNRFASQLSDWTLNTIRNRSGAQIYKGQLAVVSKLNADVTTAFPIDEAIGQLKPGAYVMVARPADDPKARNAYQHATQWFVVSDLGLTAFTGDDGIHAFVRSLTTTAAKAGVELKLVARNNEVLATQKTDENGYVRFPGALTRGEAGAAPALLVAETKGTDYAFLDLGGSAFDLSDRGVTGRPAPGPIDAYLTTERGVYRPGEDVHLTALVRTRAGRASALPVTLIVSRPDGVTYRRTVLSDDGLGGRHLNLPLVNAAMTGTWRARVYLDPKGEALSETAFLVEDFVPERLDLTLKPESDVIEAGSSAQISARGVFLYGPPAADMGLEGDVIVTQAGSVKGLPGYHFGLADETVTTVREPLTDLPNTDADGRAVVAVDLPQIPKTQKPLSAKVVLRLREPGGRTVERSVRLPVDAGLARIGVKPLFKNRRLGEGETANFEVVLLDRSGKPVTGRKLTWTLSRLDTTWQWYRRDGIWRHEAMTLERRVQDGTIMATAPAPAKLSAPVQYGRYLIEIADANEPGTVTSLTFSAGWFTTGDDPESPEMLDVALDKAVYAPGETARLRINDKRGGRALVTVISGDMKSFKEVVVPPGGGDVPVEVSADWGAGAYVAAMLYRAMDETAKRMPTRAVGIQWIGLDQSGRTLEVSLGGAEKIGSAGALEIPVSVQGLAQGEEAYVTVAAVDAGILNLTGFKAPDPGGWFNGQTKLAMAIRDYYGRLIDGMRAERGRLRSGGDAAGGMSMQGSPPVEATVALFSGLVPVDGDGNANISFDLPDFNGRVRLMAMAWSAGKIGRSTRDIIVRDPVAITIAAPRFLTLGDSAEIRIDLHNVDGTAGDYALSIDRTVAAGAARPIAERTLSMQPGERKPETLILNPDAVGVTTYGVSVKGPGGLALQRTLTLDVKAPSGDVKRTSVVSLAPGETLTVSGADLLSDLIAARSQVGVSVGKRARFNVPALIAQLDRYPYGCAEQTVSKAMPLLYANAVAAQFKMASDATVKSRINGAIDRVLQMQDASGSFGAWGPGAGNMWLTAYVTDFLGRAREAGYDVAELPYDLALDRLQNFVAYASDFKRGGETRAYALYVLAKAKRAPAGELRYYADERLGRFATPLAKAQIGVALAMIGDSGRATRVLRAAIADVRAADQALKADRGEAVRPVNLARADYGSALRDGAGVLALVSEAAVAGVDSSVLSTIVADRLQERRLTSTQEQAWLLMAAHQMATNRSAVSLSINGVAHSGQFDRTLSGAAFSQSGDGTGSVKIANTGTEPVDAVVSVVGAGVSPEPAVEKGFSINRRLFTLDGAPLELTNADGSQKPIAQNTRAVVVLDVTTQTPGGQPLVVDRLPAGFEIENPRLVSSGDLSALAWLKTPVMPEHTAFRDDRFMAAFDLNGQRGSSSKPAGTTLSVAYVIRAVTPGTYVQRGASVEDMYRPELMARSAPGQVVIVADEAR